MRNSFKVIAILMLQISFAVGVVQAAPQAMKVDRKHVQQWNNFVAQIQKLHLHQLRNNQFSKKTITGGYPSHPEFYIEERFYSKSNGQLLSRIQWEKANPVNIHLIEVFVYDESNRLKYDYMAAYLPEHRNAPIQTLINFHFNDGELNAYRQFDASGDRIYEQCMGKHFNKSITVSLDEHEIPANSGESPVDVSNELYLACFNHLPATAGKYLNPESLIASSSNDRQVDLLTYEYLDKKIQLYSNQISSEPRQALHYINRGKLYFEMYKFEKSISDLTKAIKLDNEIDEAWFWRGMSYARNGQIDEGIADLSVFIKRNPTSSRGYTKRGVRYIWKGDLARAESDLKQAIELDNTNAEAHDDLGVIYAQRGDIKQALKHFTLTISIDPSYQKAWHNRAMAQYIATNHQSALKNVNEALRLSPYSKNSLLLKGEILIAMGDREQGERIIKEVDFLPESNWSEVLPVK